LAELNQASQHKTRGIVLHNDTLSNEEIATNSGVSVTTAARTAFDLGRRYGRTLADVDTLIDRHRGTRGIVQLREVIRLADVDAESPQETRTRLVLTGAGLRPQRTQIDVFNRFGDHVHRIDMGWPQWKVGVEYDGEQHWTNPTIRAKDIDQEAELEALGWRIIRVSAEMLRYRPHTIVERARAALRTAAHRD
jgi:very-short-patch-repair endonuclease